MALFGEQFLFALAWVKDSALGWERYTVIDKKRTCPVLRSRLYFSAVSDTHFCSV
jgi:hypothetical protein